MTTQERKLFCIFTQKIILQDVQSRHVVSQNDIRNSQKKNAVVLGISKDSVASHKKFEEKYGLVFTLLSDTDRKVIEAYDVWKEKKNYGKVYMGIVRTTYLIDENGIIVKANDKVKAADDPENMLKEING